MEAIAQSFQAVIRNIYARQSMKLGRPARFFIVGVGNTLLNFLVLNAVFYGFGFSKLWSSIIATSCAMFVSFFLNRSYVFKDKRRTIRQAVLFLIVTTTGVMLIQNGVFYA